MSAETRGSECGRQPTSLATGLSRLSEWRPQHRTSLPIIHSLEKNWCSEPAHGKRTLCTVSTSMMEKLPLPGAIRQKCFQFCRRNSRQRGLRSPAPCDWKSSEAHRGARHGKLSQEQRASCEWDPRVRREGDEDGAPIGRWSSWTRKRKEVTDKESIRTAGTVQRLKPTRQLL
jgi:hypothetical protein